MESNFCDILYFYKESSLKQWHASGQLSQYSFYHLNEGLFFLCCFLSTQFSVWPFYLPIWLCFVRR